MLEQKPNVRILACQEKRGARDSEWDFKRVRGGLLVQDRDGYADPRQEIHVVTKRQPTDQEWTDLLFAWQVCRHVRSNAIVLARDQATVGVGAGQMSRVDSVKLAVEKSREWDPGAHARRSRARSWPPTRSSPSRTARRRASMQGSRP